MLKHGRALLLGDAVLEKFAALNSVSLRQNCHVLDLCVLAHDPEREGKLVRLDLPGLLAPNTTRLALRRGIYRRSYAYAFILNLVPGLTEEKIAETILKEAVAREDFVI